MATRLAENGIYTVAVVENGNLTIVPGYYNQNLGHPSVDWNFKTTPQAGLENQTFDYARGKTLGGSSALNVMAYHRGTRQSYAAWADAVGDPSYVFDSFLPFFEKSINYTTPDQHLRAANATVPRRTYPPSLALMVLFTYLTLTGLHHSHLGVNLP
jgi:choline dehydrogenase